MIMMKSARKNSATNKMESQMAAVKDGRFCCELDGRPFFTKQQENLPDDQGPKNETMINKAGALSKCC